MRNKRFYKTTIRNVIRIFRVLKQANRDGEGSLTVSEIARRARLHKWTVSRSIDLWMSHFVEVISPEELSQIGLTLKLVRLSNPRMNEKQVLRHLRYSRLVL